MAARKLAEAWVTIRPDMGGFAAEAKTGITAALKNVAGKIDVGVNKASLAAMRADIKAALAGMTANIDVGVSKASLAVTRKAIKDALATASSSIAVSATAASLAKMRASVRTALDGISINLGVTASSLAVIRAEVKAALTGVSVNLGNAAAVKAMALGLSAVTAAGNNQGRAVTGLARVWGRWGGLSLTAIHWIVSGVLELTAVLVPATAAAAAWAAVWLQGSNNVLNHMQSVYTATEAMANMSHQTAGQMIGLGNALQKAQDAANPDVYQALGGAIKLVNSQSGAFTKTGLAVGKVFDTFVAKLVYDFSSAGDAGQTMGKIFSQMVPDLTKIGQVFGNLGHTLGLLAASMPGLAEALLGLLALMLRGANDVVSFADKFSFMGVNIFTAIIGIEEFMRWGGLLVTLMGKMGIATDAMGAKFLSWQRFSGVFTSLAKAPANFAAAVVGASGEATTAMGGMVSKVGTKLSGLSGTFSGLGTKVENFGKSVEKGGAAASGLAGDMEKGIAAVPFWQVAIGVVAVAALGFLVYKLATAKTAAQQFAAGLQAAVNTASNLNSLTAISDGLQTLQARIGATRSQLQGYTASAEAMGVENQKNATIGGKFAGSVGGVINQLQTAKGAIQTYVQGQQQLASESITVLSNSVRLAAMYHTTIPGAMALAQTAGVKITSNIFGQGEAAAIARNKIADLVTGYTSMGRPMSVVGNDMVAVAIQTGEQDTQVAKVTAAWTSFMATLTGGTNDLATFQTSLKNMTTGIASATHNLGKGGGLTGVVTNFGAILDSTGKKSSQAWQNFDQVVGQTAPDLINWLTTAGSMGAISGGKFVAAAKDMIAQLLPFAKGSKTATAELTGLEQMAGGPAITSFKGLVTWVGHTGDSSKNLQKIIDGVTQKMSNMSQIAQNLGTVLQTELVNMMDKARLSASGVSGAMVKYTKNLEDNTASTGAGQSNRTKLIDDLIKTGLNAQQSKQYVDTLQKSIDNMHGKQVTVGVTESGVGKFSIAQVNSLSKPGGKLSGPTGTAKGWLVSGGTPGIDSVPIMAMAGETVVPKHLTPKVAPLMKAYGVPGFASGGFVGNPNDMVSTFTDNQEGNFQTAMTKAMEAAMTKAMKKAIKAASGSGMSIADYAKSFATGQGHPYVWGGTTPAGWDCSGFTEFVYNHFGYNPPRTSEAQMGWARPSKDQAGALAFFNSPAGGPPPGHVGISLGNGQMANAAGIAFGTIISSTAGNMGFGIPPGGFRPSGGGVSGGTERENQLSELWIGAGGPGGQVARIAAAIAMAESGGRSNAFNPSGASGLWQILGAVSPGNLFDPQVNARNAVIKYEDAHGFSPWVTFEDGAYMQFMAKGGKVKKKPKKLGVGKSIADANRAIATHPGLPIQYQKLEMEVEAVEAKLKQDNQLLGLGQLKGDARKKMLHHVHDETRMRDKLRHQIDPLSKQRHIVRHAENMIGGQEAGLKTAIADANNKHMGKLAGRLTRELNRDKRDDKHFSNWMNRLIPVHAPGGNTGAAQGKTWIDSIITSAVKDAGLPVTSFDRGGALRPGLTMAWNGTGKNEKVVTGETSNVVLHVKSSQTAFDMFMTQWLQHAVFVKGGGNVQVAFGRKA